MTHADPSSARPTRRGFLGAGAFGALSVFWTNWLRQEAAGAATAHAKARSVILIFNAGAPSHIDLWDPKPRAPSTVRGPFKPIATNVPGLFVSELLPHLAAHADKLAVVRTVHHRHNQHNSGMYWSIAGRPYRTDSTLINPGRADYPGFGPLVGWLASRDGSRGPLPPYVITPAPHCDSTAYITPGQFGGCLGARYDPLILPVESNPKAAGSLAGLGGEIAATRLRDREALLDRLGCRLPGDEPPGMRDFDVNRARALALATAPEVRRAFDLSREPAPVRERYGRHRWGQSHLLARRLVEAGVRFVTAVNGPSIVWDTHKDNFRGLKDRLVPPMEQAFAALLSDLSDRGLLASTLVVWMGDFGRTPLVNKDAGRDHWPHCYTMVLAGGGIRGGQAVGESDRMGAYPKSLPVTPADVHATVFTALGYDPLAITYRSPEGRPTPLCDGEAIAKLL